MAITTTAPFEPQKCGYGLADSDRAISPSSTSAVSWGAIAAGAAAGASLSLILLILGVGLGLSSVSPWSREGVSAASFGVSTIAWLMLTQLLASAMGGYLAGRLRTKWMDTQADEIYFRDTAHGFLAWAVASLATAALLTSLIGSTLSGGLQPGVSVGGGIANSATFTVSAFGKMASEDGGRLAYFVDSLFRPDGKAEAARSTRAKRPVEASERTMDKEALEVGHILMNVSRSDLLPLDDIRYVGKLVAQRTGVSQHDAEKRVTDIYARAQAKLHDGEVIEKETADKMRKASAYAALWIFVSLLSGAFVASLAATYGGRQRDA